MSRKASVGSIRREGKRKNSQIANTLTRLMSPPDQVVPGREWISGSQAERYSPF